MALPTVGVTLPPPYPPHQRRDSPTLKLTAPDAFIGAYTYPPQPWGDGCTPIYTLGEIARTRTPRARGTRNNFIVVFEWGHKHPVVMKRVIRTKG